MAPGDSTSCFSHCAVIRSRRRERLTPSARAAPAKAVLSSGATRQLYTSLFSMHYSVVHRSSIGQRSRPITIQACHLDLSQWATDPTWKHLSRTARERLVRDDVGFL